MYPDDLPLVDIDADGYGYLSVCLAGHWSLGLLGLEFGLG